MRKYRIKEWDGWFTIEVWGVLNSSRKNKKTEGWHATDFNGNPYEWTNCGRPSRYSASFGTLDEARAQVKSWKKGVVYHDE